MNLLPRIKAILVFGILSLLYILPSGLSSNSANQGEWRQLTGDLHSHAPSFLSAFFFNSNQGIVMTPNNLKRTNDGGQNWENISDSENLFLDAMVFNGEHSGLIIGKENNKPVLLEITGKDKNWIKKTPNNESLVKLNNKPTKFFDFCFDRKGGIWAVGSSGIFKINIFDKHWEVSDFIETENALFSIACGNDEKMWAVGEDNELYRYKNNRWEKTLIERGSFFTKIKIINNDLWLLGGPPSHGVLLKSQDNGLHWEDKTPRDANTLFDIYLNDGEGWVIGAEGAIYQTIDNGNSWNKKDTPTKNDLTDVFFLKNEGWIMGDRSTILKYPE